MIRVRTLWPHRVGGLTFWSPRGGYVRVNSARTVWTGEGSRPAKIADDWMGPGRERRISWWQAKKARRRVDDRASWRNA